MGIVMGMASEGSTKVHKKKELILLLGCTHQQKAPSLGVTPIKHPLGIHPVRGTWARLSDTLGTAAAENCALP